MKHPQLSKSKFTLRLEGHDGQFILHLSLPIRWLAILAGLLAGSVPLVQVIEALARLPH